MKTNRAVVAIALFAAILAVRVAMPAQAKPSFVGTWEGKMNDLPGIELKISEANGKISGVMTFYFQERSDPNGPWQVKAEHPVPLLEPHEDGHTLTFEVQHHKCHTCAELGPNVKFRMELGGANEADLWNLGDKNQERKKEDLGPSLKLIRRAEPHT